MRLLKTLALAVALTAPVNLASADIVDLIGGVDPALRNGNLNDLTGAAGASAAGAPLTLATQTDGSRAGISDGAAGSNVTIPFFTAIRSVNLVGGNSFFGFDDGTGTPLGGVVGGTADRAFLYNNGEAAGAVDLIHDQFVVGAVSTAPATFTLTYDFATDDADSDSFTTPLLAVAGTALTPTSITLSNITGTASVVGTDVLVEGADSLATITALYTFGPTLTGTETIDLAFDQRIEVDAGALQRAAIDNINLSVEVVAAAIPEPGSLSLLAIGGLAAFVRRKRSA